MVTGESVVELAGDVKRYLQISLELRPETVLLILDIPSYEETHRQDMRKMQDDVTY